MSQPEPLARPMSEEDTRQAIRSGMIERLEREVTKFGALIAKWRKKDTRDPNLPKARRILARMKSNLTRMKRPPKPTKLYVHYHNE
jgi:hypothetical protein